MEAALELEDDVFFADLSKQISLLIMDDKEEDSLVHYPSVNLQVFNQAIHPANHTSFMNYDQQIYNRESKGTGVFIPRSPHPRRKNAKQGKSIASGNKFQRPSDHKSRGIPQMTYSNNFSPSYDSFNYRRI
ncbi:hypothetical protein ACJIZ3_013943 [Penstemon smallii]|uniref:Uncharacterized protein n=1 Tax=Penstemon smallii TaxID=265156 RepID=A0ABD3RI59_9LAMI